MMKYLKLFESVDPPYEKITYGSYLGHRNDRATVDITHREEEDIINFIINTHHIYPIVTDRKVALILMLNRYDWWEKSSDLNDTLVIRKMEDEWYFVRIVDIGLHNEEIYKCDQWSGLLKCLEDKILIIPLSESIESNLDNPFYYKISEGEFFSVKHNDLITFNSEEVEKINDLVYDQNVKINFFSMYVGETPTKHLRLSTKYHTCQVFKIEDEWYLLSIFDNDDITTDLNTLSHYKCDQWEGLVKFIKDKILTSTVLESISIEPLYTPITLDEYPGYTNEPRGINFTDEELSKLSDLMSGKLKCHGDKKVYNCINPDIHLTDRNINRNSIRAISAENGDSVVLSKAPDEWYYVRILDRIYKCDQWEGFIRCIQDEILIGPLSESVDPIDPPYEEINSYMWNKLLARSIGLGEREVDDVTSMIKSLDMTAVLGSDRIEHSNEGFADNIRITIDIGNQIIICLLEDEWYIVISYNISPDMIHKMKRYKCYKCDQLVGLRECIKMLLEK